MILSTTVANVTTVRTFSVRVYNKFNVAGISVCRNYVQKLIFSLLIFLLFIHYLQLGRHPVASAVTCYISTDYEDFPLKFRYGGLHEKHVVATLNCRVPSQHLLGWFLV